MEISPFFFLVSLAIMAFTGYMVGAIWEEKRELSVQKEADALHKILVQFLFEKSITREQAAKEFLIIYGVYEENELF